MGCPDVRCSMTSTWLTCRYANDGDGDDDDDDDDDDDG